ncbi:HD domain-containing protein [Hahella ganghwensis]|uniref:HD domain-containing protein n=1 Tax=Hahella ganghwensis TaxID=286420 RepID=UPI0004766325|nr:HD domain-containing protein [Hahella ganghwensis]
MDNTIYDLLGVRDRLIMDPVHGGISLFRHEVAVLDHPLFQRLRYICQNDILSFVFPGATHSRFLHSIGTMHVGHRMYRGLIESCLRRFRKEEGSLTERQLVSINYFNQLIRLACLLHDCGHSSFSHQFSQVSSIGKLLDKPGRFQSLWAGIDAAQLYPSPPQKLEHEHFSVRCAYEILGPRITGMTGIEARDVIALMETTSVVLSDRFSEHAFALWELVTGSTNPPANAPYHLRNVFSLIVSGEIDADRADYMLRDGFHSSVTIGGFNLDHLLKNLHIGWDPASDWMGLAITAKGLGSLEDFVYSRHQMYRKVYGHKTSIGFDWILRQAIEEVLAQPEVYEYIDDCLSNINSFRYLTDNYFWEQFRVRAQKDHHSFSAMMMDRRRLEHLHSIENVDPEFLLEKVRKVASFNNIDPNNIVCCELNARFSKIREDYDKIKVLNKKPLSEQSPQIYYSLISEESSFFQKFADTRIVHFYRDPRVETS